MKRKIPIESALVIVGIGMLIIGGGTFAGTHPFYSWWPIRLVGMLSFALWLPILVTGVVLGRIRSHHARPRWLVSACYISSIVNFPVLVFLPMKYSVVAGPIAAILFIWLASRVPTGTYGAARLFALASIFSAAIEMTLLTLYPDVRAEVAVAIFIVALALAFLGVYTLRSKSLRAHYLQRPTVTAGDDG